MVFGQHIGRKISTAQSLWGWHLDTTLGERSLQHSPCRDGIWAPHREKGLYSTVLVGMVFDHHIGEKGLYSTVHVGIVFGHHIARKVSTATLLSHRIESFFSVQKNWASDLSVKTHSPPEDSQTEKKNPTKQQYQTINTTLNNYHRHILNFLDSFSAK